ncbi:MAG: lactate utilization protein [Pyrinomonadaceae bacterium]|nr:lactate utilization protein [Pyrinomonadaceae bacterium]
MDTNTAKSAIFDSIRRNLAESLPFDEIYNEHKVNRPQDEIIEIFDNSRSKSSLAEIFRENLRSIGANCEIVEDKSKAVSFIQTRINEKKLKKIAVSDAGLIGEIVGLLEFAGDFIRNASKEVLFETDLGITSAQFGIAETGTLVIESDKEFNRLASLVPPIHICVLEAEKIHQTLGEVLQELEKDLSRSVTFITGQSRTSDIELTLALGVHGPAELHVILIEKKI